MCTLINHWGAVIYSVQSGYREECNVQLDRQMSVAAASARCACAPGRVTRADLSVYMLEKVDEINIESGYGHHRLNSKWKICAKMQPKNVIYFESVQM